MGSANTSPLVAAAKADGHVDERERAIADYNRQRAKSRRKVSRAPAEEIKAASIQQAEIEPLVNEPEPRSRRARKAKSASDSRRQPAAEVAEGISADHPILKRKRVQRDLSQVVFGPTQ